jgi:outer membrane protein assembly factor BamB
MMPNSSGAPIFDANTHRVFAINAQHVNIPGVNLFTPNFGTWLAKLKPPLVLANPGPDRQATVGVPLTLDGSNSVALFLPLSYSWKIYKRPRGSNPKLENPNTANPTFTADKPGDYILMLTVKDIRGNRSRNTTNKVKIIAKADIAPPVLIQNFQASDNEDGQSTLTWTNPADNDLAEVIVRRKTGSYPTSHNDGDDVTPCHKTSPTPGASERCTDTGLINGTTYYYAVFSRDRTGNWNDQVVEGRNADTGRPQVLPPPLQNHPWPMFQHDAQHTGRSKYSGPTTSAVAWVTDIGTALSKFPNSSQPVIDKNGVIYIGLGYEDNSPAGKLYAINPDGSIKWVSGDLEGIPSTPAIGLDGTIYVGTRNYYLGLNGVVYSIDPANGAEKWRFICTELGDVRAITLGSDGTLYFACSSFIYALNPDGTEKWRYGSPNHGFVLPPAIGPDGTIYAVYEGHCGYVNGWIHALNPDGSLKWADYYGYGSSIPVIGPDGNIHIVTDRRCLSSGLITINPDGQQLWAKDWPAFDWLGIGPDGSIIAGARNQFLPGECCRRGGYVYAFNNEGVNLWSFERENEMFPGFVIDAQGTIFVTSQIDNTNTSQLTRVYAIRNGIEQWSIDIPGIVASLYPSLGAPGRLFVPFVIELADYGQQRQLRLYAFGNTSQSTAPSGGDNSLGVVAKRAASGNIMFSISGATAFEVTIFNLAGSQIYHSGLVIGRSLNWSGLTTDGKRVANGVYLYVVTVRTLDGRLLRSEVRKLVILR